LTRHCAAGPIGVCEDPVSGDEGGSGRAAIPARGVSPMFTGSRPTPTDDGDMPRLTRRAVASAAAGDPEGLRFLYERYSGLVYRYVRSIVGDEHEAQDLTQLVFLKLMWTLDRYDEHRGHFSTWLLRIAHNLTIDHVRRLRPVPAGDRVTLDPRADDGNSQRRRALHDALADLSAEQREVLILRQVVGLRPGEIARRMDRSEGSVHALHHRARAAMRTSLARLDAAPATHRGSHIHTVIGA
jgi:RNA polymerase sigma-70 factor (ECF subfamily)